MDAGNGSGDPKFNGGDDFTKPVVIPRGPPEGVGEGELSLMKEKCRLYEQKMMVLEEELYGTSEENKRLKERLAHFLEEYPQFESNRKWHLQLLEEEKVTKALVQELNKQVGQVYKEMLEKEDQASSLTRMIDKLKLRKGKVSSMEQAIQDFLNVDGKDAVLILPEEVWRMILNLVTKPKDLWNCSHSCTLFKKILQDWWRPTWLFQQAFPLIFRYLPKKQVLKCRLVSSGWNMMVEQYLESHPSLRPHTKDKEVMDSGMLMPFGTPLEDKGFFNLIKFDFRRQWFRGDNPGFPYVPGRNPFLGRAVKMIIGLNRSEDDDEDEDLEDDTPEWKVNNCRRVWAGTRSFLETFGEHIWYLTVDTAEGRLGEDDDVDFGYQEAMLQLLTVDIPTLVPNLRKLRILSYDSENYMKLVGKIDIQSLPAAPKLETIQADESHINSYHALLGALVKRNHSTIRALHWNHRLLWECMWDWKLEWPNLTELYLDHLQLEESGEESGVTSLPRLRKLGVNLRGQKNGFDWLLDLIHNLFGTAPLSTLRIIGGIPPSAFQQIRWKFCMSPTLKTLEVEHGEGADYYAFLIHFPLVENIHVFVKKVPPPRRARPPHILPLAFLRIMGIVAHQVEPEVPDEDGVEVEEVGRWEQVAEGSVNVINYLSGGRIYQSNIWELLPRLKLFTFKWDKFTREGYEAIQERM